MPDQTPAEILADYIIHTILKQPNRKISLETELISGGVVDSFHLVDLALFIEDQFGVQIADTELNAETFDTLADLVELIQQKQAK